MNKRFFSGCVLLVFYTATAVMGQETITTRRSEAGVPAVISFETGPSFTHTFRIAGFIPVKTQPQIAVWVEDSDGKYIETLYVTRRSAVQDWRGGKTIRRPEALPCWSHRRGVRYSDGLFMPTSGNPLPDAVTSATPKEGFTIRTVLSAEREQVILFVEMNQSFDYNPSFPKNAKSGQPSYSGVNGQPSAIYSGEFTPGTESRDVELRLIGYGSPDGSDGVIRNDLSVLTTAKDMVKRITVRKE